MRSRKELIKANGESRTLPSKCDHIKVEKGDLVVFDTWGGGGWGSPLEREPSAVATDVIKGLVSVAGARRYGVVLNAKGEVDSSATEALRADMATTRHSEELFSRGGSIDEIKARCLKRPGCQRRLHQPGPTRGRSDGITNAKIDEGEQLRACGCGYECWIYRSITKPACV